MASTNSTFREEMHDGFEMLGSQVSLALESVALAEVRHERKSQERLQTLVQNSSDITTLVDAGGKVLYQSPSMEWVLGRKPEASVGRNLLRTRLVHPEDLARHNAAIVEAVRNPGVSMPGEFSMLHRDGSWRSMEGTFRGLTGESGVRGVVVNCRDVTERAEAGRKLREAEARYRVLVEQVPVVVYVLDAKTMKTLYDSPRIEMMLGYPRDTYEKDPYYWEKILHPEDRERVLAEQAVAATKDVFEHEYRVIAADGRVVWVRDEAVLVRDGDGNPGFWQGVISDITARKALEEQLRHQALHDTLTGLPNRALFADRLAHALAQRDREEVAVLFLDLDDFKTVNDSLTHSAGDRLLVEVGERLTSCVRPGDTVARLGGGEFAVLIEDLAADEPGAEALVAERILVVLRAPFVLEGRGVFVHSSIGIARGTSAESAEELLRNADVAMYMAKRHGKGRYEVYRAEMHDEVVERLELRAGLRRAIERGEVVVHYQPVVSLAGERRMREAEALVRWEHPKWGLIWPAEFIRLAEETGDIVEIGDMVLESACRQVRAWQEENPEGEPLTLSVNLSARQFARPDLCEAISAILEKTAFDPRDLKLEITESVAMGDVDAALFALKKLKSVGVQVAIDDFGTGYSSLSYLSRFPVDTLKIDRSFVGRLENDPESAAIVSATVDLAHNLGLEVTAEGVETATHLDLIEKLGCDLAQGFFVSRPLPPEGLERLLRVPQGSWRWSLGRL